MTYVAISFVVAWGCGVLFLAGRNLNFTRLIYNSLASGKTWKHKSLLASTF
jgi:hypothetical protein